MNISKDLVAASAAPLVLAILSEEASYGYAIRQRVVELSGGELAWADGILYPVLHRLERNGYVEGGRLLDDAPAAFTACVFRLRCLQALFRRRTSPLVLESTASDSFYRFVAASSLS